MDLVRVYVLVTLITGFFSLSRKNKVNKYLLAILLVLTLTELAGSVLSYYSISVNITYRISFLIHNLLWLAVLRAVCQKSLVLNLIITLYVCLGLINLIVEKSSFSFYPFIVGAFLYIGIFIMESFKELKKENLFFFTSNNYILLVCPIIFFLGLSFIFI